MRSMRLAALAVAMTLMFGGLAFARDHDHDKHDHWDKHWDKHNDRDHHDKWREHDHNQIQREREHHWWEREHRQNDGYYGNGQIYNRYPQNYPSGNGYPGGAYPGGGYPGSVYGGGGGRNAGYGIGLQDGSNRAREDMSQGKPFNPNPRGSYGNRDHGYNNSYGDKTFYRAEYTRGYEQGYQANYRGGRGRGWGF